MDAIDQESSGTVSLGTEWATAEDYSRDLTSRSGGRVRQAGASVEFLDWTIDGRRLRSLLRLPSGRVPDERTRMLAGEEGHPWASASLLALLEDQHETRDSRVRYDTGRTAVLYCPQCQDLGCPAVTAHIEFDESTVRWRQLGYETKFSESPTFETFDRIDLTFDRVQYEATIRQLLAVWGPGTWDGR
ncbi:MULTISPECIES: hypothetical protein [Microbacterium]|uniref:hypothetical protein n=1 Tax=Microbacterium TaxID=33882 RepID=UPI00277DC064|nr:MULTISPECIES: hypothetical protein [Microbacterium]MDQ1076806.1 hypothetical protein [Microbacterium sp. SORGH_AS_0969]MDQ1117041.1 hypothetical protein [Microbacterium testaceum]